MPIFDRVSAELPVTLKTASYTVVADDNGTEVQFQSTSAATASLPGVSAVDNGFNLILRNVGSGSLTVDPETGQTIDGAASLALAAGDWRWIRNDGTEWKSVAANQASAGDVFGPASATDNAIARFDGTTGKAIQNSGATIDDSGNIAANNLSGTNTGDQTITLTGNVTGSGTGSFAATIADDAVTYAKIQDISATQRVLGRNSAGAGDPEEVTLTQFLDWIGSPAQGDILYRGVSAWQRLAAGTSGQFLQTQGSGADPQWADAEGGGVPIGTVIDFAADTPPSGYLACDGSAVSRTNYADLFAVIGTTWGAGDGSTTFNLPDFQRRTAVGKGGTGTGTLGNAVGATGGEEEHTLTVAEMPSHSHSGGGGTNGITSQSSEEIVSAPGGTGSAGGGNAHNNIQPSAVVTKAIKH